MFRPSCGKQILDDSLFCVFYARTPRFCAGDSVGGGAAGTWSSRRRKDCRSQRRDSGLPQFLETRCPLLASGKIL